MVYKQIIRTIKSNIEESGGDREGEGREREEGEKERERKKAEL